MRKVEDIRCKHCAYRYNDYCTAHNDYIRNRGRLVPFVYNCASFVIGETTEYPFETFDEKFEAYCNYLWGTDAQFEKNKDEFDDM